MKKSQESHSGRVSLKELAKRLNTSVCTISKALHNKPKVSEKMREKVLALANKLGYSPNILARSMAQRPLHVALIHPIAWPSYNKPLINGVIQRAEELRDYHISVKAFPYSGFTNNDDCISALNRATTENYDAIILVSAANKDDSGILSSTVEGISVPIVILAGGHVPNAKKLCVVSQHSFQCGAIAANLAQILLPEGGLAGVIVGIANVQDHSKKNEGFRKVLSSGNVKYVGCAESYDEEDRAYSAAEDLFTKTPDISLVYVGTENISGVLSYLKEHDLIKKVKVIATGTGEPVNEGLADGSIQFAIDEHPMRQGEKAMDAIFQKLLLNQTPPESIMISPGIRVKQMLNNADNSNNEKSLE